MNSDDAANLIWRHLSQNPHQLGQPGRQALCKSSPRPTGGSIPPVRNQTNNDAMQCQQCGSFDPWRFDMFSDGFWIR